MNCLNPIRVKNPRYRGLSKSELSDVAVDMFGDLATRDPQGFFHPLDESFVVPCGRCERCLSVRKSAWRTRLLREYDYNSDKKNYFVTLTFDDENLQKYVLGKSNSEKGAILTRFIDRFRKRFGSSVRYFFISELGEHTGRFHFHGILFDAPVNLHTNLLRDIWKHGYVVVSRLQNGRAISYCIKYITKLHVYSRDCSESVFTPVMRASLRLGFREDEYDALRSNILAAARRGQFYTFYRFGKPLTVPRYYRKKVLTPSESLDLWLLSYFSPKVYKANGFVFDEDNDLFRYHLSVEYGKSIAEHRSLPPRKKHDSLTNFNPF